MSQAVQVRRLGGPREDSVTVARACSHGNVTVTVPFRACSAEAAFVTVHVWLYLSLFVACARFRLSAFFSLLFIHYSTE